MDIPDAVLGKLILVSTATLFIILVFWINTYPFIDTDLTIYQYIPDPKWALLFCATWGFFFHRWTNVFHAIPYLSLSLIKNTKKIPKMTKEYEKWIVIGVSGVTCGGKTTLANQLKHKLSPVYIFHQDKYFYPDDSPHHIKCVGLDHNNYDILSSLDMKSMYNDIIETMKGKDKSHASFKEKEGRFQIEGKSFLVIEGFTVLNYEPISSICNLRYYFVLEYEECVLRRAYRLYDPPDIDGYFDQCVWPEHLKYRAEIEGDSRVKIIDGTGHDALDIVLNDLKRYK